MNRTNESSVVTGSMSVVLHIESGGRGRAAAGSDPSEPGERSK